MEKHNHQTIEILFKEFLRDRQAQNLSQGTIRFYHEKFEQFLRFARPNDIKNFDQLTSDTIRSYLVHLSETDHKPGGLHAAFRTLRAFFIWYEEEYEPVEYIGYPINLGMNHYGVGFRQCRYQELLQQRVEPEDPMEF